MEGRLARVFNSTDGVGKNVNGGVCSGAEVRSIVTGELIGFFDLGPRGINIVSALGP